MNQKEKFMEMIALIMFVNEEYDNEDFVGCIDEDKFDKLAEFYFPEPEGDYNIEKYCIDKIKTLAIELDLWKEVN